MDRVTLSSKFLMSTSRHRKARSSLTRSPVPASSSASVSTLRQGYNPVTYFETYPGRFLLMHRQDWVNDSSTKSGFLQVPLGKGSWIGKQYLQPQKQVA